jgi:hypothetical protein
MAEKPPTWPALEAVADDRPTVDIRTEVYCLLDGWRMGWRETDHERVKVKIHSEKDLACALAMQGPYAAALLAGCSEPSFRLTAHCLTTHLTVANWEWGRPIEDSGPYLPLTEIWCVWDEQLRVEALAEQKKNRNRHD